MNKEETIESIKKYKDCLYRWDNYSYSLLNKEEIDEILKFLTNHKKIKSVIQKPRYLPSYLLFLICPLNHKSKSPYKRLEAGLYLSIEGKILIDRKSKIQSILL